MNRIFLTTTALLMVTLLTACGGSADQAPLEPVATTEAAPQPTAIPAATDTVAPTVEATETTSATEAPATEAATTGAVSYVNDVKPILDAKCIKCHGVETKKEGLDMLSYDSLMVGSRQGPVLIPGNATDSLLVQLIVEGEMPNRGPKLTPEELQIIIDWVNQGAVNN